MTPLGKELDNAKVIGRSVLSLFNVIIVLTILAVVLSNGSAAAVIIQQGFGFLAWLVSLVVAPVSGTYNVNVDSVTPAPAGSDQAAVGTSSAAQSAFGGSPNDVSGTAMSPLFPGVPDSPQAPLVLPNGTMTPGGPVLNGIVPFSGF